MPAMMPGSPQPITTTFVSARTCRDSSPHRTARVRRRAAAPHHHRRDRVGHRPTRENAIIRALPRAMASAAPPTIAVRPDRRQRRRRTSASARPASHPDLHRRQH
jgi:hypothetical protein